MRNSTVGSSVRCSANQSRGSDRAPARCRSTTACATRSISSSHRRPAAPRSAGARGVRFGTVQRGAPAITAGGRPGARRRSRSPSLRSGRPEVSSPPTGNQPRHARPAWIMAISAFSTSGSAKNSCEARSSSVCSAGSTPWPTMPKNPISRHASSIWTATSARSDAASRRIEKRSDVDDRQVGCGAHNW